VFILKLIEYGVPVETITILSVPLDFIYMIWPILMSNYTSKSSPFIMFYKFHAIGMLVTAVVVAFVGITPHFKDPSGQYSVLYFVFYMAVMSVLNAVSSTEHAVVGAIFSNVADPEIGGTYMTLLSTLYNLGCMYPNTIVLYLVGFFTVKQCVPNKTDESSLDPTSLTFIEENTCSNPALAQVVFINYFKIS
jgi:PAT family acetyl-CoA transporter-like MFS transporter 1